LGKGKVSNPPLKDSTFSRGEKGRGEGGISACKKKGKRKAIFNPRCGKRIQGRKKKKKKKGQGLDVGSHLKGGEEKKKCCCRPRKFLEGKKRKKKEKEAPTEKKQTGGGKGERRRKKGLHPFTLREKGEGKRRAATMHGG